MARSMLPPEVNQTTIARELGISEASVSRALHKPEGDTPTTRAVREWFNARGLIIPRPSARPEHKQALLIVPDIANPFFAELTSGIASALLYKGIGLSLALTFHRFEDEERAYHLHSQRGIDGVIYLAASEERDLVDAIANDGLPLVIFDRRPKRLEDDSLVCQVSVDVAQGIRSAVDVLHDCNKHERIGFVTGPGGMSSSEDRYEAFTQTMSDRQLPVDPDWIFHGAHTRESGKRVGIEFLQRTPAERPTALLFSNDEMATGFLVAIQEDGTLKVPDDVSIVGLDGTDSSLWRVPPLSSVEQQIPRIVAAVSRLLYRLMSRLSIEERTILIRPHVRITTSVGFPSDLRKA